MSDGILGVAGHSPRAAQVERGPAGLHYKNIDALQTLHPGDSGAQSDGLVHRLLGVVRADLLRERDGRDWGAVLIQASNARTAAVTS